MMTDRPGGPGRWFPVEGQDLPDGVREEGAFLPRPLLADDVRLGMDTFRVVADAQEALGALAEAARRLGDRRGLTRLVRHREAQASAGLDGVPAPLVEVFLRDLPGVVVPRIDETLTGYLRAQELIIGSARDGYELDVELLGEASALTTGSSIDEVPRWRADVGWVGGVDPKSAVLITAPPGPELVVATEQFCSWAESETEMPVVCKLALGFYQLVVLAPMPGSDHVARLWPVMELVRRRILPDQILPFADWLRRHRDEFHQHLRGVVERGDLDSWVAFVARGVEAASRHQLRQIAQLVRAGDELLEPYIRKAGAAGLIVELIGNPITNTIQIAQRLGVSERHARTLTKRLVRDEVLEVIDNTRSGKVYGCHRIMQVYGLIQKSAVDADHDAFLE